MKEIRTSCELERTELPQEDCQNEVREPFLARDWFRRKPSGILDAGIDAGRAAPSHSARREYLFEAL
jgi:hypothetical protein